jgi:hypothetical protein
MNLVLITFTKPKKTKEEKRTSSNNEENFLSEGTIFYSEEIPLEQDHSPLLTLFQN